MVMQIKLIVVVVVDHNIDVQYECNVSLLGSQTKF